MGTEPEILPCFFVQYLQFAFFKKLKPHAQLQGIIDRNMVVGNFPVPPTEQTKKETRL